MLLAQNSKTFVRAFSILALIASTSAHAENGSCGPKVTLPPTAQWRAANTQLDQNGQCAPTDKAREAAIKQDQEYLEWGTEKGDLQRPGQGDVYEMLFHAGSGVKSTMIRDNDNDHAIWEFGNLGPSGVLKGTLLAPVSGHTGWANAQLWSKTDTYNIWMQDADDTSRWSGKNRQDLVKDVPSLDIVTHQELSVQLKKGHPVYIMYQRFGTNGQGSSGGPGGFWKGRVIELRWDGT